MTWPTALTDPQAFCAERADDPGLRGPALVVQVVGLLGLLSAVPTLLLVFQGVPREPGVSSGPTAGRSGWRRAKPAASGSSSTT